MQHDLWAWTRTSADRSLLRKTKQQTPPQTPPYVLIISAGRRTRCSLRLLVQERLTLKSIRGVAFSEPERFSNLWFFFFFFHWQKYSKSPGRNVRVDQDLVLASLLLDISKWDGLYQGRSFITRRPWRSTSRAARLPLVSANRIDEAFASNHRDSLNYFSGTAPPLNASNSRLRQTNSIGAPIVWV